MSEPSIHMTQKKYHQAPLVPKKEISLIVLEWSNSEAEAIRKVLERFNYRVDTHWIGSRKEFIEILKGATFTHDYVILSNHGDKDDGMYTCPEEEPLTPTQLEKVGNLKGKTVVSLGCATGTPRFGEAFLKVGCNAYIAPEKYPFATASLLFVIHLFYQIAQNKKDLPTAYQLARSYDEDAKLFKIFGTDLDESF